MKALPRWCSPELALVVGIPVLTVLGGLVTLYLANVDLSDDGEHENARRTAQVQTADLAPDLSAARAGLTATLRVDRRQGQVRVSLPGAIPANEIVELEFVHSLHADRDLHARLQPRRGTWVAALSPDAGSRWRVVVSDRARSWRLVGTLPRGDAALTLRPALPRP